MRALVLSGGGSFGAYQAGVWKALEARAWEPDVIIGVSIGCVNAFAISRGASDEEMTYIWRDLPSEVGGIAHRLRRHPSFASSRGANPGRDGNRRR